MRPTLNSRPGQSRAKAPGRKGFGGILAAQVFGFPAAALAPPPPGVLSALADHTKAAWASCKRHLPGDGVSFALRRASGWRRAITGREQSQERSLDLLATNLDQPRPESLTKPAPKRAATGNHYAERGQSQRARFGNSRHFNR